MQEYKPSENIIDKACDLWVEMLSNPKFDALGTRSSGDDPNNSMGMAQVLGKMNAENHAATPETLQGFATALKKYLMSKLKFDNQVKKQVIADDGWYMTVLGVDYNPDMILSLAADESGVDTAIFPWKTNMSLRSDYLSLSYGYGAEYRNYYPLDKGWLVTTLHGSDINKVIDYVQGGKPEFTLIKESKNATQESRVQESGDVAAR